VSSIVSLALSPVCANFGLGLSEWRVLATLGAFGELNGKVVSRRTGMHKTAVSRIAQRLVARHLIQMRPNPADQRAVYLRLTAQGQQVKVGRFW
jgi:DNA-binding MarR family transcriptional regulator